MFIMKESWKIFIVVAFLIVASALGVLFAFQKKDLGEGTNKIGSEGEVAGATTGDVADYKEKLAQFMRDKGMVLYCAYWSSDCKAQKDLFQDAAKYLDYVECDTAGQNANSDECIAKKVESYPTWIYQDKQYKGVKALSELAEIVGFSR